jgi:hypothetical protein
MIEYNSETTQKQAILNKLWLRDDPNGSAELGSIGHSISKSPRCTLKESSAKTVAYILVFFSIV